MATLRTALECPQVRKKVGIFMVRQQNEQRFVLNRVEGVTERHPANGGYLAERKVGVKMLNTRRKAPRNPGLPGRFAFLFGVGTALKLILPEGEGE